MNRFFALLSFSLFCSLSGESADFVVDRVDDDVATPQEGMLRWAVAQAEATPGADRIFFDEASTGGQYIDLESAIVITTAQDLVVSGKGLTEKPMISTFLALGGDRIFQVEEGASLELIDLALSDGVAPAGVAGLSGGAPSSGGSGESGGAIYNEGNLVLRGCEVFECYGGAGGAGGNKQDAVPLGVSGNGGGGGHGGGIYSVGATATVYLENCLFRGNRAGVGGAAGNLEAGAAGSIGLAGEGGSGGAIFCGGGSLEIVGCNIHLNEAGNGGSGGEVADPGTGGGGGKGGSGGGVALVTTSLRIVASVLSGNRGGTGGVGGNNLTLFDIGGAGGAGGEGGGIHVADFTPTATAHIERSLFLENRAGRGNDGGTYGNFAPGLSGTDGGDGGSGGAIFVTGGSGVFKVRNTTFHLNTAGDGGLGGEGTTGGSGGAGGNGGNGGALAFAKVGADYAALLSHVTILENFGGAFEFGGDPGGSNGTPSSGGGLWEVAGGIGASGSGVTLANSVVSLNGADSVTDIGAFLPQGGNYVGGDPGFGPLADNGGPTLTFSPRASSPTIDRGGTLTEPLSTDQRGFARFRNAAPDLGAVEVGLQPDARIGKNANPATHQIDNFYTATGAGQTRNVRLVRMRRASLFFSVENDGDLSDDFLVSGSPGNRSLRINTHLYSRGGGNVTAQMAGGHVLAAMQPGEQVLYRIDFKARSKKRRARQNVFHQVQSMNLALSDLVLAKVLQKREKRKPKRR